jgi:hypothetical protein
MTKDVIRVGTTIVVLLIIWASTLLALPVLFAMPTILFIPFILFTILGSVVLSFFVTAFGFGPYWKSKKNVFLDDEQKN